MRLLNFGNMNNFSEIFKLILKPFSKFPKVSPIGK